MQPNQPLDLDIIVPHPVAWPDEPWVDFVNIAKDEFEVDGAGAVFSTWRVQEPELLGGSKLVSDARMTDERAARLLGSIPEGEFNLRLKFLRRRGQGDWFIEEKMDSIREGVGRG